MTAISPLPPSPLPSDDEATLNEKMFATIGAFPGFIDQSNAQALENNAAAAAAAASQGAAAGSATSAAEDATAAANSAQAAAASAGAAPWIADEAHEEGMVRWSPLDNRVYRCKADVTSDVDPSIDTENWGAVSANGLQLAFIHAAAGAVSTGTDTCFTHAGVCTGTAPPAPLFGDAFTVRYDNDRFDNELDLGANGFKGPNGVVATGVLIINFRAPLPLRWWGDYWRVNA